MPCFRCSFARSARSFAALFFAAILASLASPALAGVENPEDTPSVQAVQFDMALVKRLNAVGQAIGKIDDAPTLYLRTKPNKVPKTLDELIAKVHASPATEAAIKAQGFTAKQYLVSVMAWANAWFGYHLDKSGGGDAMHASPAQLRFVEQHYAELKALQEQL